MAYDSERKKYAKEHFWYVEIEVDSTTRRFCENRSPLPTGLDAIPSLSSVSVNPSEIDLTGGLGVRAKCNIKLQESNDYTVWGTLSNPTRFWARWRAENPYYKGHRISVFSGYIVNDQFDPSNFTQRDYIIESFGMTASGVSITGKDPLKLASNDRAKAPVESKGSLLADITDLQTTMVLQPSGIGSAEYPSSNGIVRIGDEVIEYTTRSGDNVSGMTRGAFNTQASAHDADDLVQLCLYYDSDTVSDIDYDLLTNYASVATSYINKAEWDAEVDNSFTVSYTCLITEPTGVQDLIKEFSRSAPHYLYYDERVNKIRLSALKPPPNESQLFTWEGNFLSGSTGVQDKQDMRVSTVICNFGIFDPTKDLDEVSNYRVSYVREDSDSVTNYGQRAYHTVNSRWIPSDNKTAAVLMAARIGRRFADVPRMMSFDLDAKDADVWVGDSINIQTDLIMQSGGGYPILPFQILSAGENKNFSYTALEHTYGEAVAGDEDVEDPDVRLIYIVGENDRLIADGETTPRTLRDLYEDVFGSGALDADLDIRFIFENNAVAGSSTNAEYAIRTGAWPELTMPILIQNAGYIVGRGGDATSGDGGDGGGALQLQANIRLNNNNTIGGGGGAGGYAASLSASAGGGGGAGFYNGQKGPNPSTTGTALNSSLPEDGTVATGGAGGYLLYQRIGETFEVEGGAGGNLGQSGENGQQGTVLSSGGSSGKAIDLNGFTITYINTGTISGTVS